MGPSSSGTSLGGGLVIATRGSKPGAAARGFIQITRCPPTGPRSVPRSVSGTRPRHEPSARRPTTRRVPDDVAVTGWDNVPDSAYTAPPLTTVDAHVEQIVQRVVLDVFLAVCCCRRAWSSR